MWHRCALEKFRLKPWKNRLESFTAIFGILSYIISAFDKDRDRRSEIYRALISYRPARQGTAYEESVTSSYKAPWYYHGVIILNRSNNS